jgi:hypothetical protein
MFKRMRLISSKYVNFLTKKLILKNLWFDEKSTLWSIPFTHVVESNDSDSEFSTLTVNASNLFDKIHWLESEKGKIVLILVLS